MTDITEVGRPLSEELDAGMDAALEARFGPLVTGMAEGMVDFAYGRQHARERSPLRDRYPGTIAALTASGGQTEPELKVNTAGGRKAGLTQQDIAEMIWQKALRGGLRAGINGLSAAVEVFEEDAE